MHADIAVFNSKLITESIMDYIVIVALSDL